MKNFLKMFMIMTLVETVEMRASAALFNNSETLNSLKNNRLSPLKMVYPPYQQPLLPGEFSSEELDCLVTNFQAQPPLEENCVSTDLKKYPETPTTKLRSFASLKLPNPRVSPYRYACILSAVGRNNKEYQRNLIEYFRNPNKFRKKITSVENCGSLKHQSGSNCNFNSDTSPFINQEAAKNQLAIFRQHLKSKKQNF